MSDRDERRIYVLRLRPLPGVDAIRELRWVLKGCYGTTGFAAFQ
jgi:hypothetical protein